jgi:hypothetical protein
MAKRHGVRLRDDQRVDLAEPYDGPLTRRPRNRVQILLRADSSDTDADTADDLGVAVNTAANVRKQFAPDELAAALTEKHRPGGPAKLDGKAQAIVVALECSQAADG